MKKFAADLFKKSNGKNLVVVGAGVFATHNMRLLLESGIKINFFVDSNYKNKTSFTYKTGYQVLPYESINPNEHFPFVFHVADITIDSICLTLSKIGFGRDDYAVWPSRQIIFNDICIGKRVSSLNAVLECSSMISSIGHYSAINYTAQVISDHNATQLTTSTALRYNPPLSNSDNRIKIGHDVWIGANTVINASKVSFIGNGAIIGACAVVIEDVPPYSVVVGVPAKVKKFRFSPWQIEVLERTQWWNWDDDMMKKNADCFADVHIFFERFK